MTNWLFYTATETVTRNGHIVLEVSAPVWSWLLLILAGVLFATYPLWRSS